MNSDPIALFCERATRLGLRMSRSEPTRLARRVADIIQESAKMAEMKRPRVFVEPDLELAAALESLLGDEADLVAMSDGFSVDVGITGVHAAVAETGSLVCASGARSWRAASLLPPVHIAIVRERQIVADLDDLFSGGLPSKLPASLTLISGPSKTADIEGVLVTGVHGPGEVHVVVV